MRHYVLLFALMYGTLSFSQSMDSINTTLDDKYREDQIYASITYNVLIDNPEDISQGDFSTGFHFGFIRDMPFNEKRNWSLGLGLGISSNSYNQNLLITENAETTNFSIDDGSFGNVSKNKFTTYLIDVPFELRWRTSNKETYKFWRVYPGFKFSYLVYNSTKLNSELLDVKLSNSNVFNSLQYGLTLSAGYGTWNFQLYYGLNSIFEDSANLNNQSINSRALRVGLMFYIL